MFRLVRENVVKLTDDPSKRDRLVADGFTWEQEKPENVPAEKTEPEAVPAEKTEPEAVPAEKPAKGKAADDGKSAGKA